MKKLFLIALLFISFASSAQLTLSQKSDLATNTVFQGRIYQALFSKANVFLDQTPNNLEWQKKVLFGRKLASGVQHNIDINTITRAWLANYNGVPQLDSNNQPTDSQILESNGLDVIYNLLAGVKSGDEQLPVVP